MKGTRSILCYSPTIITTLIGKGGKLGSMKLKPSYQKDQNFRLYAWKFSSTEHPTIK
jgi:hypothetical protein